MEKQAASREWEGVGGKEKNQKRLDFKMNDCTAWNKTGFLQSGSPESKCIPCNKILVFFLSDKFTKFGTYFSSVLNRERLSSV